ncbi:MAG: hypothetical protein NVSMB69_00010 [Novosphingobium sp.]
MVAFGAAVRAQSFLATPTVVVSGSASVFATGSTTTVTVNSPSAVINWTPNDTAIGGGPINFQPPGTTATFVNNPSSTADFAVLNNILPTDPSRMVQFNGNVISQLQTLAGASSIGGTVYFYSPGGILVSPTAVINVGNLGLSASPIAYNATTGSFGATGSVINNGTQTVTFGQANAGSSVQILSGAQINASSSDGSYVAVVAPRINNTGTINVNGNAALVAADAATITFQPSGLYSISLDVGTSATGTALFNGGTITGSASTGAAAHQIYLVTAPKNTLINMLIGQGSNVGFDVAGAANVSGNSIILSGGYDIISGSVDPSLAPKGGIGGSVNANVTGSNVTSALTVISSNNAQVDGFNGFNTTLASDTSVLGYKTAYLGAFASSTLIANGRVTVRAIDRGSSAALGTSVTGGTAQIFAQGGTVALHSAFNSVDAQATGVRSQTSGVAAGDGTGGTAQVIASSGGSITVDGSLFVSANGQGGFSRTDGVAGGNGKGGNTLVQATGTNSNVILKSNVGVAAQGQGGTGLCLTVCTAEAGTGTGGNVQVIASAGGSISAQDPNGTNFFTANADGFGGEAVNTNAGIGTGGSVFVTAQAGALNFASTFSASALGHGGTEDGTKLVAGSGTGGTATVNLQAGGTLSSGRTFSVSAQGIGGAGDPDSAGTGSSGGTGTGGGACDATGACISGGATIFGSGGSGTFNMGVNVDASGFGGYSGSPRTTGVGGAGTGGFAQIQMGSQTINTNNASLAFNGPASVVSAIGHGGSGYPGGLGQGGTAIVRNVNGTIVGTGLMIDASGIGGNALLNGVGGTGGGGSANLITRNNPFGTSTNTFDSVTLHANALGGAGGASSDPTLNGGAGGAAMTGVVGATADAGDGKLTVHGLITGDATAFGGAGGNGANNATGIGSNGGAGGAAFGGFSTIGSQSFTLGTTSAGTASFGSIVQSGQAIGGKGGDGGNVSATSGLQGNGGAGGDASGGGATLLVRGTPVTISGQTTLSADAFGGNGGQGAIVGNGGNALVGTNGQAAVLVTNRFQVPTQRGSLSAGDISGSASAVGGSGALPGTSTIGDVPINFTVTNSDVTASSVALFASGTVIAANSLPSTILLSGGTVNTGSSVQFSSSGPITVGLDTATLTTGFIGLSGSDWILPTAPTLAGTIDANTGASFRSGNNIVTYANVNFAYPVSFNVIGNFQLGNVTATGDFSSFSGGTSTFGSITTSANINPNAPSAGNVDIQAGKAISVGTITGPGYVSLDNTVGSLGTAGVGNITVASIVAGRDLGALSNGSVFATGAIQTGANVFIDALGSVTIGNVGAGLVNPSTVAGDTFEIAVRSGGPLIAGNLASRTDIGLLSAQTISTGTLTGQDMLLLGRGNMVFGAINAGARVLIADVSMGQLGGTFGGQFDKNAVFAGALVQSSGSITASSVAANQFTAASQQNFTSGALATNAGPLLIDSGAAILTGNLAAAGDAVLHAGGTTTTGTINARTLLVLGGAAMSTGSINASRVVFADQRFFSLGQGNGAYDVEPIFAAVRFPTLATSRSPGSVTINGSLNALFVRAATALDFIAGAVTVPAGIAVNSGGTISIGAIQAGNGIDLRADRNVLTSDVSVMLNQTPPDPNAANSATFAAGGSITTGNVQTRSTISFFAQQGLTTGSLSTIDLLGLAAGNSNLGAIIATGRVLLADVSMAAIGTGPSVPSGFDANLVFAAAPVRSAGAIAIGGTVQAGQSFTAATQQGFTSGAISTTTGPILVDSGAGIKTGNIASSGNAVLHAGGTITTGTINASTLLVLGGGTMSTQAINARGAAIFADASTYALGATSGAYNVNAVIAGTPPSNIKPFRSAGAININGNLNTAFVRAATAQSFTSGAITAPLGIVTSAGGSVTTGNLLIGNGFTIQSDGNVSVGAVDVGLTLATTDPNASGFAAFNAGGNVAAGNIRTRAGLLLIAGGTATIGSINTNDVLGLVHGVSSYGPITATGRVLLADQSIAALGVTTTAPFFYDVNLVFNAPTVSSSGPITINGAVSAASLTTNSLGALTSGAITTANFVDVTTGGNALVNGTIQSGQETSILAQGGLTVGNITAGVSGGTSDPVPISVGLVANGGSVVAGNLSGTQSIGIGSSGSISTGTLSGANLLVGGGSTITTGAISMSGKALLASFAMIAIGGTPGSNTPYDATRVFAATPIAAPGAITINGTVNTGDFFHAATLQGFTSGAITAGADLSLAAGGALQVGALGAGGPISITADSLALGGGVATPGSLAISTVQALTAPNLTISGNIALSSQNALAIGNVTSSNGSVLLVAGNSQTAGTINAGVINAATGIALQSTGATSVQGLTSSGAINFNSLSTFTNSGQTFSAFRVIGQSTGAMTLGSVTTSGGAGTVELASLQGSLTAGRISATTDIATIAAGGALTLGQVSGRDILLLASSNVQVGAVSAGAVANPSTGAITGATGRVLIANSSAGPAGGKFGSFNYNAVFNATGGAVITNNPPRIGGAANVTGTVNAGVFGSYSQGAMTGQVINAFGSLEVESGGLVTVGQRWTSPDLSVLSNDIAIQPSQVLPTITTTAGLVSGTTGTVTLASLNPNGAFIGDGLTAGQGYALSNAEVGLVQSGSLTIAAAAAPGLATTMTIGTLSLTGSQAGSPQGTVQFATGNPQTLVPGGTIRVIGAVTAKGFANANQLEFNTGTFELDTAAGSLGVTDSNNAMTGGISISADRIHIAAASILDKLRVDPRYAGRITELNTPPTQPSAGPVLSASQLFFAPTQTLYIQNTGTAAVPAGFLVPLTGLTIETPSTHTTQPGQTASAVSIVINGQFIGTPAPITGATAFMQFIQQTKLTGITADSQFNGCLISAGTCGMTTAPAPDLSTQIQVLQTPALPSAPAIVAAVQQASPEVTADPQQQEQTADKPTEAEQKDEKEAKASAKAPIAPPAPMIDTRPLSPPVSVDEPVAGGGNPALFGIGTAPNPTEGGDK